MSEKPDYFKATNEAYKILWALRPFDLRIDLKKAFEKMPQVAVHPYSTLAERFGKPIRQFIDLMPSEHGLTISHKGTYEVWYNDFKETSTIRFTLAHELGHIVMGHTEETKSNEREANCFARNLLCPIPAVRELGIKEVAEYMEAFDVSEPMARAAKEHADSDYFYIDKLLHEQLVEKVVLYMYDYNSVAEFYV